MSIFENPTFIRLLKESSVADPREALSRDFFKGLVIYKSHYTADYVRVYSPALTTREMEERAKDPQFCKLCFKGGNNCHYLDCRLNPWNASFP